eukprot:5241464-Amphidinium_carterae.1
MCVCVQRRTFPELYAVGMANRKHRLLFQLHAVGNLVQWRSPIQSHNSPTKTWWRLTASDEVAVRYAATDCIEQRRE